MALLVIIGIIGLSYFPLAFFGYIGAEPKGTTAKLNDEQYSEI